MSTELYENYQNLVVNPSWIGLGHEENRQYFCTPVGAEVIGWNNGIHFCYIRGLGEMIFAVNPDTCCDYYVYPIAENFTDFLRLVLAAHGTNAIQQIILWNQQQYTNFINSPDEVAYASKKEVANVLHAILGLGLSPMEQPFEYVKNIQQGFDYSQIPFRAEYYDVTGLERP